VDAEESAILSTVFDWGEFFLPTMQSHPKLFAGSGSGQPLFGKKWIGNQIMYTFPCSLYDTVPYW
jgi:hypothetical protein